MTPIKHNSRMVSYPIRSSMNPNAAPTLTAPSAYKHGEMPVTEVSGIAIYSDVVHGTGVENSEW